MIPMPPAFAIAIAIADSVTVSMADETSGTASEIVRVSQVPVFTLGLGTEPKATVACVDYNFSHCSAPYVFL